MSPPPRSTRTDTFFPATSRFRSAGIYVTTSRELLDWSEPRLVWAAPLMFVFDCGAAAVYAYPSLIDAKSDDLSFGTVGAEAKLYLTRRSEEHPSELQPLLRISYAVVCLTKTQPLIVMIFLK